MDATETAPDHPGNASCMPPSSEPTAARANASLSLAEQLILCRDEVRRATQCLEAIEDTLNESLSTRLQRSTLSYLDAVLDLLGLFDRDASLGCEIQACFASLHSALKEVIRALELEMILPEPGTPFDVGAHRVIEPPTFPVDMASAVVCEVRRRGWQISHGVVLRPAEVVVGSAEVRKETTSTHGGKNDGQKEETGTG